MPEAVGIANLPNQRHKIVSQSGAHFTLMVCGESGTGKTTFVNTLFNTELKETSTIAIGSTTSISINRAILEEKNFKLHLNIIDTPGFGSNVDNLDSHFPIIDFIDDQHESFMKQEQQPKRLNKVDLRVHACIYFIRPTGHSLKPLDIQVMKSLSSRVNLIPVISKSDTLSLKELINFKSRIRSIIESHDINIYTPPLDLDDPASAEHSKQLIESMPFAIVSSTQEYNINGQLTRARSYPWGYVEIENDQHCDFKKLRSLLLRTNMLDLISSTNDLHFESFRSLKLNDDSDSNSNKIRKSKRFHNPKFKQEEDALKKFFTEQVKAEEQRFRQWETNIVNERNRLNKDLEEMQDNLKLLEEQVRKLSLKK